MIKDASAFMETELILITGATALMAAGLVLAVLLPAWIAWLIAWRSGMPKTGRRWFALVCLLLTYGVIALASALLLPLGVFQIFIAPDLHQRGHVALGNAIFVAAEHGAPIISLAAGVIAAVIIPLRLRRHWAAITTAVAAEPVNPSPDVVEEMR